MYVNHKLGIRAKRDVDTLTSFHSTGTVTVDIHANTEEAYEDLKRSIVNLVDDADVRCVDDGEKAWEVVEADMDDHELTLYSPI